MGKQAMRRTNIESLMDMLGNKNGVIRQKARESLVVLGKPAVPSLIRALQNTKFDHLRWEAAKTLGAISDTRAIPSLVKALEDSDSDVAWLAAEALRDLKKDAWSALLRALIESKEDSVSLRQGAHHVLQNQKEEGFNDLLKALTTALVSNAAPESTVIAANELLKRMKMKI